jgi:hypothetical protein
MVRAILEGRKTVTRRVMNERALKNIGYGVQLGGCHELPSEGPLHPNSIGYYNDFCPYGQPGDRLWVRETWMDLRGTGVEHRPDPDGPLQRYAYCADSPPGSHADQARKNFDLKWKPSIHIPRAASRILLEITSVRAERLQDISEEQAQAEGIVGVAFRPDGGWPICTGYMVGPDDGKTGLQTTATKAFAGLWDSVGGTWDANPWRRVQAGDAVIALAWFAYVYCYKGPRR